jgi:hypothetical protein
MVFLSELIKDRERLKSLQSLLPNIVPDDKSLWDEIKEAISSDEYEMSDWEGNSSTAEEEECERAQETGPSNRKDGPSYFDKGKWQSQEDYDTQQEYKKAAEKRKAEMSVAAQTHRKKDQPALGVTLDDIRPPGHPPGRKSSQRHQDPERSMAALPAGGYFTDKMRAKATGTIHTSVRA